MAYKDIYSTDYSSSNLVSPLEGQILSQYQLLAVQLKTLSSEIKKLNSSTNGPNGVGRSSSSDMEVEGVNGGGSGSGSAERLLDSFRNLEMKIGLVYTLFKGAVYSLFLQYEEDQNLKNDEARRRNEDEDEDEQGSNRAFGPEVLLSQGSSNQGD